MLSAFIGFVLGVALGSYAEFSVALISSVVLLSALIFFFSFSLPLDRRQSARFVFILLLGCAAGLVRVGLSDLHSASPLEPLVGKQVSILGIVVEEPDTREASVKLTVSTRRVTSLDSGEVSEEREKILITAPLHPQFHYGDLISFETTLLEPENFDSDGRTFDYKNYLRARGIWHVTKYTVPTLVSSGHGSIIKNFLFSVKGSFTSSLEKVLPAPEVSLLGGLLLGAKRSLGQDILSEFSQTGVSHIVVLSGYNIAIVAESIMDALAFLPVSLSVGLGAFGVILFTIMSGAGASAVRAMLMVMVVLLAKHTGREYFAGRALALAVFIMLFFNPILLIFDPSFQLSVLATVGLVFVSPILSPYFSRLTESFGLREIVSSTLATQMTVLPYLIYSNGIFSMVSLPVNVLILGTIPLTMLLGFLTGLLGFLSVYLAYLPGLPTYLLLNYQLSVVRIGASVPFGWFALPAFSFVFVVLMYALFLMGLLYLKNKQKRGK